MSESPAFTRREFLTSTLAMVSTVTSVPTFLSRSAAALADTTMRTASRPGVPEDRVLVVIQLSGGNDGLNTVIPFGEPAYYRARPQLALPEKSVLPVDRGRGIGLHPSLAQLRSMMEEGLASVVQGVGYPNPNRSHFASMDVWHTGDTTGRGGHGHGWIGQALDTAQAKGAPRSGMECICLGAEAPLAAQGRKVRPVAFERADLFRWIGRDLHSALDAAYDALHQAGPAGDEEHDPAAFIFRTACDAQVASQRVRKAVAARPATSFPPGELANQLRMVASMIRAELPTRVYYVAMGGFDTHANQAGQHERLLREFAQAMHAFYRELEASGHSQRVLSLAFSEFGRRVQQNASGGTDHGTAGPMFLFGPRIRPGLLGNHPSLDRLDQGDLIHQVDFRSIYAAVLEQWMQVDSAAALGARYKPAQILRV